MRHLIRAPVPLVAAVGALLLAGCAPAAPPTLTSPPARPTPTARPATAAGPAKPTQAPAAQPIATSAAKPSPKAEAKPVEKPAEKPPAAAAPRDLRRVTLYLPLPAKTIALFPLVVPGETGFFREEGLEVTLETTDSPSLVLQQLAAGRGDGGWVAAATALQAFARNERLVAVHEFLVQPLFRLIVPADSQVRGYADLKGRDVGVERAEGSDLPELRANLARAGLNVGRDVRIVPLGEDLGAVWPQVTAGKVAAFHISYNNRVRLESTGVRFRGIDPPVPPGQRHPSLPLLLRKEVVEREPAVAIGLGRAINKAIVFARANPDAALAIQKKAFPPEHSDPNFARLYLQRAIEMSWPPEGVNPDTFQFGEQSLSGWKDLQKLLVAPGQSGGLDREFALEPFVITQFIKEMNAFDRRKVEADARASPLKYP